MFKRKRSPENEFIVELIKTTLGNGNREQLRLYLANSNPQILNNQIRRHGLGAYFYKSVTEKDFPLEMPVQLFDAWKQYSAQIALQNTLIEQEGAAIFKYLNKQDIEYTLLKGFAYAEELYGSKWIRPVGDLDILISRENYPQIKEYLFQNGYTFTIDSDNPELLEQMVELNETFHNQMHFSRSIGVCEVHIDVHWDIADLIQEGSPLRQIYPLNDYNWFDRSSTIRLGGVDVNCLNREMHFIHIVYHYALGHQFAGIKWFLDLCLFPVKLGPQLDWSFISGVISCRACRKLFAITGRMVADVAGVQHDGIMKWCELYPGAIKALEYRYYHSRFFRGRTHSGTYISFILLSPSMADKWRMLYYIFFNPEAIPEWRMTGKKVFPLLQPLYIIYWGLLEVMTKGKKRRKSAL